MQEARNRDLNNWHHKIKHGKIMLPRFQRHEAWDAGKICGLIETVIHDLPLGITLVLEVGDEKKFFARSIATAPETSERVEEHLLDGQQRLTALWRAFHNNYDDKTYFVYLKDFDKSASESDEEDKTVFGYSRYISRTTSKKMPRWCDDPAGCLRRGLVPTNLLKPGDIQVEINPWIAQATDGLRPQNGDHESIDGFHAMRQSVSERIANLRETVRHYNLPYLSLPPQTDKSVALNVFINMNTNTQPLSQYDIIVAQVEGVAGQSLHDMLDDLDREHPRIKEYVDLPNIVLHTSALRQNKPPNERGAWDMKTRVMIEQWQATKKALGRMAQFLSSQGIIDRSRLPTASVLPVIAALYFDIPESGDSSGRGEQLLRKYLWRSFFTDRYDRSAATYAHQDFKALQKAINQTGDENDVVVFSLPLPEKDALLEAGWPKPRDTLARAILAAACQLDARDFANDNPLREDNIAKRHYHHVFPNALLSDAGVEKSSLALNCALISDKTNWLIGRKEPKQYLQERENKPLGNPIGQETVNNRLRSHLLPVEELRASGDYERLSEAEKANKIKQDFELFLDKRADLVVKAMKLLADGKQIDSAIYNE